MVLKCCACGLTYKDKISLFSVPRDPILREAWNRRLNLHDKILQQNDFLCENHFDSNDVLKYLKVNEIEIPNKRVRLRRGCLPIPCLVPYLNKMDLDIEIKQEIEELYIKDEQEFITTENYSSLQNPLETSDVKQEFPQFYLEDTTCFFEDIFRTHNLLGLTEYWGIHSCDPNQIKVKPCMVLLTEPKARSIVFSQVNLREGIPIFGKQVLLSEDLELRYFVGHYEVNHLKLPKICTTLEDLQIAINKLSKFKLCKGGPDCKEYKEIAFVSNCAYKDYGSMTWRHKFCNFFAEDGIETCAHCISLPKYLKVTLKKSKTLKRLRAEMGSDVDKWKSPLAIMKKRK